MLFPTALVGSYPQPEWLIDRKKLAGRFPPRVRARDLWRVPEPFLREAQDDATLLAIQAQEAAGLDIVGIWHSHPDHPARPSETDRASAWPEWSYVIISLQRDGVRELRSWRLNGADFEEEVIRA